MADSSSLTSENANDLSVEEAGRSPGKEAKPQKNKKTPYWAALLLILILLIGAFFRFTGLDWDDTYHLHPDERFLTDVAGLLESTDLISYLKTSESTLNPYNFGKSFYVYGNFPMTSTRLAAELADKLCLGFESVCTQRFIQYDGIHLIGRFLSAAVDLITVLLVFLIGKRLYDWRVGLIGSLLMAAAVLPIQQSHFFTMDNWAAMLSTAAVYAAVRASENGKRIIWWVIFGLALGLAAASRINVALLSVIAPIGALAWLFLRSQREEKSLLQYLQTRRGTNDLQWAVLGVAAAAAVSLLTFRLAQPYAFSDSQIVVETALLETGEEPNTLFKLIKSVVGLNPQWLANMEEIRGLQSPEASFPPALQWTDRTSIIFPLTNMVLWGMGITAGLAAMVGFLWAVWRILRQRGDWLNHIILVSWAGLYFIFMATRWVKSVRYFLPVYPVLFILAGWALIELWKKAGENRLKRAAAAAVMLLVIIPTLLWANSFVSIYRNPVTRVEASAWMLENIPSGATLIYEIEGEERELQLPLRGYDFWPDNPPLFLSFSAPADSLAVGIRFNYLSDLDQELVDDGGELLGVTLVDASTGEQIAQNQVEIDLGAEEQSVVVDLGSVQLSEGGDYTLVATSEGGGPIRASTSMLGNEHWDDPLPVRYEGIDPFYTYYSGLSIGQIPITNPDSEQKRIDILNWLEEADYIILSSQRALWSLPRLPKTYPLTIRYYEALFSGELGFDMVNQFHADLSIGPIHISDVGGKIGWGQPAEIGWPPAGDLAVEEAFSVYDHPPVWIFKKGDDFSKARAEELLNQVDLSEIVFMTPGQATKAANGLNLSEADQLDQRQSGTYSDIFNLDGLLARQPWLAAAVWWLAVVILGWLSFPLMTVVFRGLPDKGFLLGRIFTILFVSYFSWLLASLKLLSNERSSLLLSLALLALTSTAVFLVRKRELVAFVTENRRYILFAELFTIGLFILFILIRAGNPDVWDVIWGGEKPMDLSYFNAVLKSDSFPPYDPWFSGGYINYYYYGFVFVGALTELLRIPPTLAYNLIIPMLFSFTGGAAFTVAYNLVVRGKLRFSQGLKTAGLWSKSALGAGIIAAVFCVLIGNLAEVPVALNAWQKSSDTTVSTGIGAVDAVIQVVDGATDVIFSERTAPIYTGDWFWSATRAISVEPGEVQPITEFPFFTFLYGDLHAHMIALPLTLAALAWAVSLAMIPGQEIAGVLASAKRWQSVFIWLAGALIIGSLWATNTWDYPTYLIISLLAIFYYSLRKRGKLTGSGFGFAVLSALAFVGLTFLVFLPFTSNYGQAYSSFSLWDGSKTSVGSYLAIYGLFLFISVVHVYREFRSWSRSWTVESLSGWERYSWLVIGVLLLGVLFTALLVIRGYVVAPMALTLTITAGLLSLRAGLSIENRIPLVLISAAFFLTLFVEVIVLDGDIGRMNTVFKFYLQVWVMLSVAGGAAVVWINDALRYRSSLRRFWRICLVLLLAAAVLYPILATKAKWDIRMSKEAPITLDGMEFMKTTSYFDTAYDGSPQEVELYHDYDAIRWMQRNILGSPVIAEAHSLNPYRSIGNRVSMYTGLPAIIGWDWHQRQQRALLPAHLIYNRIDDVSTLYNTIDKNLALDILDKYDVGYIYAGQLEWIYYHPQGLLKFDEMVEDGQLEEVYRSSGVSIYKVLSNSLEKSS